MASIYRQQTGDYAGESTIRALQTAITYAKNQMLSAQELEKQKVEGEAFAPIFRAYCTAMERQRLMDYDDQMVYALRILRRYPQIRAAIQSQYRHYLVDEAQDTSKIQHALLQVLAQGAASVFMVGDEDQSIYGFRAAYPQALTEFEARYPGAKVLYLEQNYRSVAEIVAVADRFIQRNTSRRPGTRTPPSPRPGSSSGFTPGSCSPPPFRSRQGGEGRASPARRGRPEHTPAPLLPGSGWCSPA